MLHKLLTMRWLEARRRGLILSTLVGWAFRQVVRPVRPIRFAQADQNFTALASHFRYASQNCVSNYVSCPSDCGQLEIG